MFIVTNRRTIKIVIDYYCSSHIAAPAANRDSFHDGGASLLIASSGTVANHSR